MIVTLSYRIPLHDADGDDKVEALRRAVAKLPVKPRQMAWMCGMSASHDGEALTCTLKVFAEEKVEAMMMGRKAFPRLAAGIGLQWREAKEVDRVVERITVMPPWWGDHLEGYATE